MYLRWHQGTVFASEVGKKSNILCWKPSDPATCVRRVAGEDTGVTGINGVDREFWRDLSISPSGEMFATDYSKHRLVRFESGSGHLVVDNVDALALRHSPGGVLSSSDCVPLVCNEGRGDLSGGISQGE